jgi:hypothetical protein
MRSSPWTSHEVDILIKLYPPFLLGKVSADDMVAIFGGRRTIAGIMNKASILQLTGKVGDGINVDALSNINKRLNLNIDMNEYRKHTGTK